MRIWWAALVVTAGCGRILGIGDFHLADGGGSGSGGDGAIDSSTDANGCVVTTLAGTVCFDRPPAAVSLTATQLDTTTDVPCAQTVRLLGVYDACAITGTTIDVVGTVKVIGTRPLVLVATEQITIDGVLDASSHAAMNTGTGAGATTLAMGCTAGTGAANAQNGAGGGAGGSGGLIALEAPVMDVEGTITANGGGGGGGGDAGTGSPGADGATTSFSTPASGGTQEGGNHGGPGGSGGAISFPAVTAPSIGCCGGAGGGGGAVGIVWAHTSNLSGRMMISPPVSLE